MAHLSPRRLIIPALSAVAYFLFSTSFSVSDIQANDLGNHLTNITAQKTRNVDQLNLPASIAPWKDLINKYAAIYDLPPNLVAAVIWQESNGNPNAYSSSGAVGLMQVMPSDGISAGFLCKNRPCFEDRPTMDALYDPDFNIDYGCRLLKKFIENYGNVREGLLHYGPYDVGYYYADLVLNLRGLL